MINIQCGCCEKVFRPSLKDLDVFTAPDGYLYIRFSCPNCNELSIWKSGQKGQIEENEILNLRKLEAHEKEKARRAGIKV
jgi:hypothetical protein